MSLISNSILMIPRVSPLFTLWHEIQFVLSTGVEALYGMVTLKIVFLVFSVIFLTLSPVFKTSSSMASRIVSEDRPSPYWEITFSPLAIQRDLMLLLVAILSKKYCLLSIMPLTICAVKPSFTILAAI